MLPKSAFGCMCTGQPDTLWLAMLPLIQVIALPRLMMHAPESLAIARQSRGQTRPSCP